ncbi:MAG: TonB-dependent receptor [Chitinispirillaceae bacterium]|nr:TonB-dependent receptor [Chitinispirillaceae bacterium]
MKFHSRVKGWRSLLSIISVLSGCLSVFAQEDIDEAGTDMDFEDLVNVKVSIASKSEESISDAPGVISVITQDQLKRFGGTTLGDILKRVPSFLGTTVYMTDRSVIAARGDQIMPSSSHILMLINGRPIREVHEGGIKSELYESFPVSIIERIEVIRGPGSVLYGSQAFSAVINVVTKKADNNTVAVSGMLGEGLNNSGAVDLQYKLGDFGLVFAGRYADKGGWKLDYQAPGGIPGVTSTVHEIPVSIPDYGPGLYAEANFKGARVMYSYNKWVHQYYVPDYQFLKDVGVISGNTTGEVTWKKHFIDAGYSHEFTDWYNASLNATFTRSMLENVNWPSTSRDAYEIVTELTNFFSPVDNCNILLGGVWGFITGTEKNTVTSELFNKGHLQNNFSGYAQVDYRWEWLKAIGGIQVNKVRVRDSLDNVDDFKADVNPRAGLIIYPFENINIKALYSTAYRAPSINELYLDFSEMKGQMVPRSSATDPNGARQPYGLDPEKVHTFDLGLNYADKNVQFGINGFHTQMKNLIFQDRDTSHYAKPTWDNLGEITIFGLECEGKYYVTKEWLFEGSFLYQQSRDENTQDENVTPLPKFSIKGGLSYSSDIGLTISAFNTFQEGLDKKYASTLNKTTKHFNMTHLHCRYDLNKLFQLPAAKEIALVVQVDNLLDQEIWLPCWGLTPGSTIPYNKGRVIYGGFKLAF